MKHYTMHVCDICGKESRDREKIELCQAIHVGLHNIDDYRKWKLLDSYAKACTAKFASQSNEAIRNAEDEAYKELLDFEKAHEMTI